MVLRLELRGDAELLSAVVDRLTIRAELLGLVEHQPRRFECALVVDEAELAGMLDTFADLDWRILPPDDSMPTGLEDDRPVLVGERLLVRPPWVERPADFAGTELVVPRGMAFGSGEHGSTQAALLVLEALWPDPAPRSLIDVGTGSGILALYSRERGVKAVAGCDVEEPAVRAARELLPDADLRLGGPELFVGSRFDLVIANLDDRQLRANLDAILPLWNGRGPLVLSGMRAAHVAEHAARVAGEPDCRIEREGYNSLGWSSGRGESRS